MVERIYTIPLRKEWIKVSRNKRANRAIKAVREFVKRHMKTENVKIDRKVSEFIFSHNIKHPPGKIKVIVRGDEKEASVALFESENISNAG